MNRLEMLKWMWENCRDVDSAIHWKTFKEKDGETYYSELVMMSFISYTHVNSIGHVHLSRLGRDYCKEIFS